MTRPINVPPTAPVEAPKTPMQELTKLCVNYYRKLPDQNERSLHVSGLFYSPSEIASHVESCTDVGLAVLAGYVDEAAARAMVYFSELDPELRMDFGADCFSPSKIVEQIKRRTDVGLSFIAMNEVECQAELEPVEQHSPDVFLADLAAANKESITRTAGELKL
ncbi:MAG: hypothetical protein UT33_C0005G0042 [Candidatus Peregrinibacteria bacterium GW2011_GWC2_39_14]|nr:MAG: hypothetical protein US92_C0001G0042 [Candidatus Peregrinibacteria bacterium GW2011_GWA2_38_36]KKR07098.1 MAG: hypothetical protein UT33_C0005G0042 [Candidatus Peregrinibacteria bacterium GW2011_GWC2_39_14]